MRASDGRKDRFGLITEIILGQIREWNAEFDQLYDMGLSIRHFINKIGKCYH